MFKVTSCSIFHVLICSQQEEIKSNILISAGQRSESNLFILCRKLHFFSLCSTCFSYTLTVLLNVLQEGLNLIIGDMNVRTAITFFVPLTHLWLFNLAFGLEVLKTWNMSLIKICSFIGTSCRSKYLVFQSDHFLNLLKYFPIKKGV